MKYPAEEPPRRTLDGTHTPETVACRSNVASASPQDPVMVVPYVGVCWVRSRLGSEELRFLDVRQELGAPPCCLPGAVHLAPRAASGGATLTPPWAPRDRARVMAECGIFAEHIVVAYDEQQGLDAAELVRELQGIGYGRAAVLAGGFSAWVHARLPLVETTELLDPAMSGSASAESSRHYFNRCAASHEPACPRLHALP